MAQIIFNRERTAGVQADVKVYDPSDRRVVLLNFVNEKITVDLPLGRNLVMFFDVRGQPGDTMTISCDKGDGAGQQELIKIEIPADAPATSTGARRRYVDTYPFDL